MSQHSQCTVAQQFRWRKRVENVLDILWTNNTGVCRRTGKLFGELIEHFIIGGGKTCLIAESDGSMKIIGGFGRKKHDKKVPDCRSYITMYQTGTAGGINGPTTFVVKCKIIRTRYT